MTPLTLTAGPKSGRRTAWVPTIVLLLGALYCLIPIAWVVVAATKDRSELFSTFTFAPGTGFFQNLSDLTAYRDGIFWRWMANSAFYAGLGALLSAAVSAAGGYALGRYSFRGREAVFKMILAGVLVPSIVLAVPQYLLLSKLGMADSYWSMLLPSILSPYGVYLVRIYAAASVPAELMEAARMDGASEWRIFSRIAVPMMMPGLITVFLFQFVGIWNNFLLPFVMLADDEKFPITLGLYTLLAQGASQPALYTLVITGCLLAILPLIGLFLVIQRFWSLDLMSGSVKA
ncbi:multiple sugar transport system permease protein [Streptomyces sp. SAI-208]|uniref:carbohydrate ABC transporter permease n=1 Tax=unclassified Streptomyces TaxID=2593676 RepID=UPI002473A6F9|nr:MULTISPECIES: carbohydrate ABC transporter permease [unclassified Streptomyces]MDH6517217.1 multiple sugar transport system permease protein [Streptomyces sp. SAI-090]MDH6568497.1 multiple sugar transport system permease protein [Streptomyces sp. SAI-117]MDH6586554.1 multiple sugar transport system permease protein [Streptomyces sp. SAI-133]MDH6608032.1 multiple sugar transport system permease protein [Streptomyces sp. SAI-208]MDH6618694.1 multiple sugar transport system permease protein [S